ncbi:MAG: aldo/keto reductase, partial [Firmicutes bacterium]|nr:aldo/keto reductase [Bacillota bacterium]
YHGEHSELVTGQALKNGYRDKTKIADKLPMWECKTTADMERIFDTQRKRLDTDRIDYYLIHALDTGNLASAKKFGAIDFLEKLKAQGKIGHIGFSFHDELPLFKEIIDMYKWEMCMIQYNLIDVNFQAGVEGLRYAHSKGIPVMIMEPLKGSALVNPPLPIIDAYPVSKLGYGYPDIALKFLADQPEVASILSGMTTREHIDQNLKAINSTKPNSLTVAEHKIIKGMQDIYKGISNIPCSDCKYCLPCPQKVAINKVFEIYNSAYGFGGYGNHRAAYRNELINKGTDASKCNACKKCLKLCPQGIDIITKLSEAHKVLLG